MRYILEIARAREIYCTYDITKDKELVKKHIRNSVKHYGKDGAQRIFEYFKQMLDGELE